jgi:uncharacterized protein (TIGR00369 family)
MKKKSAARKQSFSWQDPLASADQSLALSGLEFLKRIAKGKIPLPPISVLMNVSDIEVEEGKVVFVAKPMECHYNPIGMVHGGFAATLLDSALACSIHSRLPQGQAYTTLELHTHYVRAITADVGIMRAEGKVVHMGSRVATAEGRLTDSKGRLYAHATTTCMVFPVGQSHG